MSTDARVRPPEAGELETVADLLNELSRRVHGTDNTTVAQLQQYWESPDADFPDDVRPAHRRRAIAQALLRQAFAEFRRRGLQRGGPGADAESQTGAVELRAGRHARCSDGPATGKGHQRVIGRSRFGSTAHFRRIREQSPRILTSAPQAAP